MKLNWTSAILLVVGISVIGAYGINYWNNYQTNIKAWNTCDSFCIEDPYITVTNSTVMTYLAEVKNPDFVECTCLLYSKDYPELPAKDYTFVLPINYTVEKAD